MNKSTCYYIIAFTCIFVFSCKKDKNNSIIDPSLPANGTWRVTLFMDSGNNETTDFSGYSFTFNVNGAAVASKSNTDKSGTWSINNSSNKFNIDFGVKSDSNKPLGELTDDWKIITVSKNEIKLKDDNDDSGEFLTFTKN